MKTLIELYDERAIENILGVEAFRPEKVIYLCPTEIIQNKGAKATLENFFFSRGLDIEIDFIESSLFKSDKIFKQLDKITDTNPDCAIDITGGTDAALFASGMICNAKNIPAFTYSRKNNTFYNIAHADFADGLPCNLEYSVNEFFMMTGGKMREGRVDSYSLLKYLPRYDEFFDIFIKNRRTWVDFITFMQKISAIGEDEPFTLHVHGDYHQKGERGKMVAAIPAILRALSDIQFIRNLKIAEEQYVSFDFTSEQVRFWLRDVGSVLELYMYKKCVDSEILSDIVSSAIVDWDGTKGYDSVSNEIDVVAARGVVPLFISCKATEVKTEALNELSILKDRFGGKGAKAAIVTTEYCNAATRHRAAQLGITVIDLEELESEKVVSRLKTIMKVPEHKL